MKLASRVTGIDVILGGHTHDAVPQPVTVANAGGKTLVTNGGSAGKFLGVLDLELAKGAVKDVRYHLLPVYAGLLKADPAMQAFIDNATKPHAAAFGEKLAVAGDVLYRRGNFNGSMDQLICDALRHELDAELALSPGFRWGNTMLPGEPITMEDVLSETAITYPEVYVQEMTGAQIKAIMEDICDNLFNPDPYYQQGGDMVRMGGMDYACAPAASVGNRISGMTLDSGKKLEADKSYKVAGWASVNPQQASRCGTCSPITCAARRPRSRRSSTRSRSKACRTTREFRGKVGPWSYCGWRRSLAVAALLSSPAAAQPLPDKPFAEHHLVMQLSDNAQDKQLLVLSVAYNLLKTYDPDKIAIEVVAFGPGIDLLRAESPNRARVDSLIAQGVQFDICMNTVDTLEREGKHVNINPKAVKVQVGVERILQLTEKGYTLVRP